MSKTWHETIIDVHLAVTDQVSHAEHMKADRYFVWQEDGENVLLAGNSRAERAVTGSKMNLTRGKKNLKRLWMPQDCHGVTIRFSMKRTPDSIIMNGTGK